MSRLAILAAASVLALAWTPALAADDPHAGHDMPAQAGAAQPMAEDTFPAEAPSADAHEGHEGMSEDPFPAEQEPAAAAAPDAHAGHSAPAPAAAEVGDAPPPPVPADHAADRVFPREAMAAARAQLRREHGAIKWSKLMLETAELQPRSGRDGYEWEARASFGGDIHRMVLKSEAAGAFGEGLERAELQGLYSRAISPYFNLQAGVRQDFEPGPSRTYAALGIEGLAPYWFELEGALFLSHEGELSARLEGSYDLRLTQRLILEPRAELNLSAQDVPERGIGSGLSDAELGLRLRYEVRPEFAPYVGVNHERRFGDTADFARAKGERARHTSFVVGLRAWF